MYNDTTNNYTGIGGWRKSNKKHSIGLVGHISSVENHFMPMTKDLTNFFVYYIYTMYIEDAFAKFQWSYKWSLSYSYQTS